MSVRLIYEVGCPGGSIERKGKEMQRWSELSPEERNKIVADTTMEGELAPYTEDLNMAYRVAASMTFAPRGKREWQLLHLRIMPAHSGQQVSRCSAYFGLDPSGIFIGAPTPAQAICLAALDKYGVQFEDGRELYTAEKQLGGPHKRGNISSIEYD